MISLDSLCIFASVSSTLCCIILKVPQIVALAKSKTIRGISISSVLLEFWLYSTMVSYAYANKYPFTAFSEYPFLVIQDFILLLMILHYSKSFGVSWVIYFVLIAIIQYCIAFEHLPKTFVSAVVVCISLWVT
ncbi:PQ-loop repeat-containing protein 3-like [Limulus polyphemus]|uniref:PQ-loop repeat-containing protein 3-like n=1 Tax=Limulus polyphemus TaxID=6850 RepID=A0ABM1RVD0_LIMPO|nr:PQ-loop repeat-containing protein 3-like [Limulus polyphemus]